MLERERLEKLRIAEEEKRRQEMQEAKEKKLQEEKDALLAEQSRLVEEQKKEQERLDKLRIAEEEKWRQEMQAAKEKKLQEEKDALLAEQSRLMEEQDGDVVTGQLKLEEEGQTRPRDDRKPFFLSPAFEPESSFVEKLMTRNNAKDQEPNIMQNNLDITVKSFGDVKKENIVKLDKSIDYAVTLKGNRVAEQKQEKKTMKDVLEKNVDLNSIVDKIKEMGSNGQWEDSRALLKMIDEKGPVSRDTYVCILEACLRNDLYQGKASSLACEILERMVNAGYSVPSTLGSSCVQFCLGNDKLEPQGVDSGDIDTALKMVTIISRTPGGLKSLSIDSIGAIVSALSKNDELEEAMRLLREMISDGAFTPPLTVFADVASAAAGKTNDSENVLESMMLLKSSGYLIDNIASSKAGRNILASGVIAADQMNNVELGLGLLAAASKAGDCEPDSGDVLVASLSPMTKSACFNIHRKAIDDAIKSESWVLAIKLISLMIKRNLNPTNDIWEGVVEVCARNKKSKESASILLDWVKRAGKGEANFPPVSIFDTVLAACEKCGEKALAQDIRVAKESIS
jgi:pentatricopeptide repeat protein